MLGDSRTASTLSRLEQLDAWLVADGYHWDEAAEAWLGHEGDAVDVHQAARRYAAAGQPLATAVQAPDVAR